MQTPLTLNEGLNRFLTGLAGRNASSHTVSAYSTDIRQFIAYLHENNLAVGACHQVGKTDITEYMAYLSRQNLSGVTRARKLASFREFFRFLTEQEYLPVSPATAIRMPEKERKTQTYLRPDEYTRMLSSAGGNVRDFCILQLFLQTGIRVMEMAELRVVDIDLEGRTVHIRGKGKKERDMDLEKKATLALKSYLALRPQSIDDHLFLNYQGAGISDRGIKKIVEKYRVAAGITKEISCHSLRRTFASYKAARGVSAFQIQQWMGHANIASTEPYVQLGRDYAKKMMEGTSL